MVEGSTYGCYEALVSATGTDVALSAASNIDGDADIACVALFKPARTDPDDRSVPWRPAAAAPPRLPRLRSAPSAA